MNKPAVSEKGATVAIWTLSALLLTVIAFLYLGPNFINVGNLSQGTLPKVNAYLNGSCALVLYSAWRAIRGKDVLLHRRLMGMAVGLSAAFLVSYVTQHGAFPSVKYQGAFGWVYYPVLISHIVLAAAIVPLVFITLFRALSGQFDKHRRIARWTLPIWFYVSCTGVAVYLFCAPYY
ncbi:MAG: DUF420 domain-containing protein [Flavobacteriales bacterium]|nr:DUF420 domain-containing protein [Flavobacteriales bacterium]